MAVPQSIMMWLPASARHPASTRLRCVSAYPSEGRPRWAEWSGSESWTATTVPSTGAVTGRPKPANLSGGSGRSSDSMLKRADRSDSSTGTKSMAYEVANRAVPWLGPRSARPFYTTPPPANAKHTPRASSTTAFRPIARMTAMNEPDSPVLRLIPYLAAITAAVFIFLPRLGGAGDLLTGLIFAAAAYFGVYYLAKLIIHVIVTRIDDDDPA